MLVVFILFDSLFYLMFDLLFYSLFDLLFYLMFDSLFYLLFDLMFLNVAGQSAINAFFCNTANPVRSSRVQKYNNYCKYAKNRVKTQGNRLTMLCMGDDAARVVIHKQHPEYLRGPHKSVDVAGCSHRGRVRPRLRSVWHKPPDYATYGGRRGSRRQ